MKNPGKYDSDKIETVQHKAEELETVDHIPTPPLRATSTEAQPSTLSPGILFGGYRLLKQLGRGGFGEVWEAESTVTGRRLALKVLTAVRALNPQTVERFKQEGKLAASLNHPHCVYIFGAEEIDGYPAITMELMRGGTLQDRLNAEGRLAVKDAVDAILNVLDGLEAAHRAGILHRDIKPSNCFLDDHRHAKIGDFGLSKTLQTDSSLTETGTFLGTPSYSSPEQVKGRDVDFRSDLYSLGATLYALLSGKPPFEGKNAGEVLARILSEPPAPFSEHNVQVPKGLQSVIFRMLAKDKEKRYKSYASLRAALLAYSSRGNLTVADLGKRCVAHYIDALIFFPLGFYFSFQSHQWLAGVVSPLIVFIYYSVTEGLWGRSLGKQLLGLRVTTATGASIKFQQVLLRTFVYFSISSTPYLFFLFGSNWLTVLSGLVPPAIYLSTMRRRNGYAGPHELISGTRVVAFSGGEPPILPRLMRQQTPVPVGSDWKFGPYIAQRQIFKNDSCTLIEALDEILGRSVWIRKFHDGTDAEMPLIRPDRPGRLRWLMGSRQSGNVWDAYEAPTGASLARIARSGQKLDWAALRVILSDIAKELHMSIHQKDLPQTISLSQVWVNQYGHATLLDDICELDGNDLRQFRPESEWPDLLRVILKSGLEGSITDDACQSPRVPLPEYLSAFLQRLFGPLDSSLQSLSSILEALDTLPRKSSKVSRVQRLLPSLVLAFVILSMLALMLFTLMSQKNDPGIQTGILIGKYMMVYRELDGKMDPESISKRESALRAASYDWARFKEMAQSREVPFDVATRKFLDMAQKKYPNVSEQDYQKAAQQIQANKEFDLDNLSFAIMFAKSSLLVFAVVAVIMAFVSRGGPLIRLFGMGIQTTDGKPAGRFRCLFRALIAWSPGLALFVVVYASRSLGVSVALAGTLILLELISMLLRPEQALQDRLAGTVLVPR